MSNQETFHKLTDAMDLLSMVEHLTDGFAREDRSQVRVPWGGIRLTIRQVQEILLASQENLVDSGRVNVEDSHRPESVGGLTLADRVQQIPPAASRARELLDNVSSVSKGSRTLQDSMSSTTANESAD